MFFRRVRRQPPGFEQRLEGLKQWGFQIEREADQSVRVRRDGCAARVRRDADGKPVIEGAGREIGAETAVLVDGGYQKFWLTPGGRREPALAEQLRALHALEEDLREALGLVSLYHTSLGTVNALHLYDRLKSRHSGSLRSQRG